MEIKIIDFFANALSESDGLTLREKILESLEQNDKTTINFEDIKIYATPFFNSSIGYLILDLGPIAFDEKINIINLTDLGKETYQHSRDNAINFYNKNFSTEKLQEFDEITKKNIENS